MEENNLTNNSFSADIQTPEQDYKVVLLGTEIINFFFLATGIRQIFLGIEIAHPIYGVLFCNLVLTFVSSIINICIFPFVNTLSYTTVVNGSNTITLIFHY